MSYNYLPLDRKPIFFDQIINLLDYEQLVSITFDAHEQIVIGRQYLDKIIADGKLLDAIETIDGKVVATNEAETNEQTLLVRQAFSKGTLLPTPIVKLTLMLKIKSFSYGKSGITIETVKRLMDMYNSDILPVIYSEDDFNDSAVLSQLGLPLMGLGNVHYKGVSMAASEALEKQGWQALQLKSKEAIALMSGYQFTNAYGLFYAKLALSSKTIDQSTLSKIITTLIDAANTPSEAIIIDAPKNIITYQTIDNDVLIKAIQALPRS
ncbi:aromatic amino acid lyase [Parasediminibacterium paludis]|uniref:Aromatic amino acid lyase n=1 Tax=Parasediminibacterium paludis TaxID=908966 RepID=A0ABV8Q0P3_9BACT